MRRRRSNNFDLRTASLLVTANARVAIHATALQHCLRSPVDDMAVCVCVCVCVCVRA